MASKLESIMSTVPEKPSTRAVIAACTLLNALKLPEQEALAELSFLAYAERGEIIWLAGAPSHLIAVVGVGFVKMTKTTPQGAEVAIELLGPGQCFGLLVAIEGREYPLSAIAVTNTWYMKIPTREFMELYNTNVGIQDHVVRSFGPRLRKAHDMMARMSTGRVEQRLAAVLLILMDSYGEPQTLGTRIAVPLTRQDLAEMAGTTVETSIRVMSRLQKEGIVTTDKQMITILDAASLSESLLT